MVPVAASTVAVSTEATQISPDGCPINSSAVYLIDKTSWAMAHRGSGLPQPPQQDGASLLAPHEVLGAYFPTQNACKLITGTHS